MLKNIVCRMLCMSEAAWCIFIWGLRLSLLLLSCASLLLLGAEGMSRGFYPYLMAGLLNETSQAVLLIGVLGSVLMEGLTAP